MRAAAVTGDRADRELLFEALAVHLGLLSRQHPRRPGRGPPGRGLVAGGSTARPAPGRGVGADGRSMRSPGDGGRRPDGAPRRRSGRCLDALSAFGRLRTELERRRAREDRAAASGPAEVEHQPDPAVDPDQRRAPRAGSRRRDRVGGRRTTTRSCRARSTSRRRRGRRRRPAARLVAGDAHLRGHAVPHPPAPRPGGHRQGLGRVRRRAPARGGAEADQARARRRRRQPRAVPAGGRGHRPARAPGDRPGLRPGNRRRRPAVLRDAVRPRDQLRGGDQRDSIGPTRSPGATRGSGRWRCGTCSTGSSTSARPSPTPTAGACSIAT